MRVKNVQVFPGREWFCMASSFSEPGNRLPAVLRTTTAIQPDLETNFLDKTLEPLEYPWVCTLPDRIPATTPKCR